MSHSDYYNLLRDSLAKESYVADICLEVKYRIYAVLTTTRNDTEMRASRRRRKSSREKMVTIDRKKIVRLVENEVKISVNKMGFVTRLDSIVVESLDVDSWGGIPVCMIKGYTKVEVKIGFLSTRSGKKHFCATLKADTGEFLAIHWEPGKILHAKKTE